MAPLGGFLVLLSLCVIASAAIVPENPTWTFSDFTAAQTQRRDIVISSFQPQWSRLGPQPDGSKTIVTITGCGFSRESYAICVFDLSFTSYASRILDDNTIICELPLLESDYFETLPHWSRLDIFWGDTSSSSFEQRWSTQNSHTYPTGTFLQNAWSYVGQFRWGPQLDCQPLSPTYGPTSGGGAIQIFGEGFDDPHLPSTLKVYFDDQLATSVSIVSSTQISVVPPAVTELGVDALVSLIWTGNITDHFLTSDREIYLWSSDLFHYGPDFDRVSPKCSFVNGTRTLTIHGRGFNDPLIQTSASNMLLYLTLNAAGSVWSDQFATGASGFLSGTPATTRLQVVPNTVSATTIEFTAPNWILGSTNFNGDFAALVSKSVSIDVYWKRTYRLINQPPHDQGYNPLKTTSRLSYVLGPVFDSLFSDVSSDPTRWFYGGGDTVCVTGDCFNEPAFIDALSNDNVKIFAGAAGGGHEIWGLPSYGATSNNQVCATTGLNRDFCIGSFSVDAQYTYNSVPYTSTLDGTYGMGPIITGTDQTRLHVTPSGLLAINGDFFTYNKTYTSNQTWASITNVCGGNGPASWCTGHYLSGAFTKTQFHANLPRSYFGAVTTVTWTFTSPTSGGVCIPDSYDLAFGPVCDYTYYNGHLTGGDSFIITGDGFDAYTQAQVYLCDSEPADVTTVATPYTGSQNSCIDTTNTDVGLVETTSGSGLSQKAITRSTLTQFALLSNAWRGRRNWGQRFDVVAYFNSAAQTLYPGNSSMLSHYFSSCIDQDVTTDCVTTTSLTCGNYRFGPVIDDLTPCQGPIGPVDTYVTAITISGTNFVDNWANDFRVSSANNQVTQTNVDRSANQHLILFGSLFQQPVSSSSSISDSALRSQTIWNDQPWMGGSATKYQTSTNPFDYPYVNFYPDGSSVGVFFDTCNTTLVPNLLIHWGPAFPACPLTWINNWSPNQETQIPGGNCDIYGLPSQPLPINHVSELSATYYNIAPFAVNPSKPDSFSKYISVSTIGLADFCVGGNCGFTSNNFNGLNFLGKCVVDGVVVPAILDPTVNNQNPVINCLIPPRPFGTQASVCIRFPDRSSVDDTLFAYGEDRVYNGYENPYGAGASNFGEDRLVQDDFANYYEICVEDQHLIYSPYIWIAEGSNGHTSGLDNSGARETLDINCIGCALYDLTGPDWRSGIQPQFYIGSFDAEPISFPPSADTSAGIFTYTVYVPTFSAEFNTDVSIAIQYDQLSVCGEDSSLDTPNVSFFKVWAAQTYHYGPVCTFTGYDSKLYGTDSGNAPYSSTLLSAVSIGGANFQDCYNGDTFQISASPDLNSASCANATYAGGCLIPQPTTSLKFEFSRLNSLGHPTGAGSPTCMHRAFHINLIGAQTWNNVELSFDSLAIEPYDSDYSGHDNSDTGYFIILPNRTEAQIDCNEYSVQIVFPDALVSNAAQRIITCPGTINYDTDVSLSTYYMYDGGNTFYGFGLNRFGNNNIANDDAFITVSNPYTDPYWLDPTVHADYSLFMKFDGVLAPVDTYSTSSDNIYNVVNNSFGGPPSKITYYWALSSGGTQKCGKNGPLFHYGPQILNSTWEDSTCSTDSICLDYDDGDKTESVIIYGRAFGCCGYDRTTSPATDGSNLFQTRCALAPASSGFGYVNNENTFVPAAATYSGGYVLDDIESITCHIPSTHETPSLRLAGYGLLYGASTTTSGTPNGDGTIATWCNAVSGLCSLTTSGANRNLNQFDNDALWSDANLMGPICYGPKLQGFDSYSVRYSGYAPRGSYGATDQVAEFGFNIIGACDLIYTTNSFINNTQIYPQNDADGTPNFPNEFYTWMTCNYAGAEGTELIYNDNMPALSGSAPVGTYCNSRLFAKQCGDGDDTLSITFLNVSSFTGFSPYTPSTWTKSSAGFSPESTTTHITATVSYGPVVSGYDYSGPAEPTDDIVIGGVTYETLNVPLNSVDNLDLAVGTYSFENPGFATVTVYLDYIEDWIAPTNYLSEVPAGHISMWGTQRATCLFGTISNTQPVTLIHQADTSLGGPFNPISSYVRTFVDNNGDTFPFNNYFTDLTNASPNFGSNIPVTCTIPQGAHGVSFDSWGSVYVLLDPHVDSWTEMFSPEDASRFDNFVDTRDTLTSFWHWTPYVDYAVKDWTAPGFVEPIVFHGFGFENYQTLSCSFGTVSATATILNDQLLVCMTPPYLSPQTVDVTFTWGTSSTAQYDDWCQNNVNPTNSSTTAYDICHLDNVCKNTFDCKNDTNSFVLPGFDITGIVSFCPKAGPIVGNTYIDFQSIGLENYNLVQCIFHFSAGDQTVDVVQRNTSTEVLYSCVTPSTASSEHVLVTVQGFYSDLWTSELGVYSDQLGSFWFDFDLPAATSVSPTSVTYGSSVTVTINGNYFTGGSDPVPESADPSTWNYYCQWQVPATQDLLTLPVDGLAPTFSSRLVSYASPVNVSVTLDGCVYYTTQFTCLTPNFQQFGNYYFEFVYDGIQQNIPADFTHLFTVLPQAVSITQATVIGGFLNASATDEAALPVELSVAGSGFAGGRINSADHTGCYICRFDDPHAIDSIYSLVSVAKFVSATELQCFTPYINVADQLDAYFDAIPSGSLPSRCANKPTPTKTVAQCMNWYCSHSWNREKSICNPQIPVGLTVSNDCGYTWSNSIDIDYNFPYPASASLAAPFFVLLVSLFSFFFFF